MNALQVMYRYQKEVIQYMLPVSLVLCTTKETDAFTNQATTKE